MTESWEDVCFPSEPKKSVFPFIVQAEDYHAFEDQAVFLTKVIGQEVKYFEVNEQLGIYHAVFYVGDLEETLTLDLNEIRRI